MAQTKLNEDFYPLTPAIAKKLREAKLTAAEWRIWSYLAEVDHWGDRYVDIDTLTVMSECDVSKATFYRAIAKFQDLELFDFQDKGFSVKNSHGISKLKEPAKRDAQAIAVPDDSKGLRKGYRKNETKVSEMRPDSQICDETIDNETKVSKMRPDSQICENQSPEAPPDKNPGSSQIVQTYSDLKKTLSKGERENFKAFCRRKAEQFEKPVVLLDSWIEKNFKELYEMYQQIHERGKTSPPVVQNNSKIISPSNDELIEKTLNEAKAQGLIKDVYWSSINNCDCVVLHNGGIMPLSEWMEKMSHED